MENTERILRAVQSGELSVSDALIELKKTPFIDLGYAKPDLNRELRRGTAEVIFGEGKTAEQTAGILKAMREHGTERVIVTRLDKDKYDAVRSLVSRSDADLPAPALSYYPEARIALMGGMPSDDGTGNIVVATGGTSDIPVAEEAAVTAEALGNRVVRLYDVGVAGLHRLLAHTDELMRARVVIAIAGMEGALASVIGGLVSCPVIAVPTSVGYGASYGGLAALLSMLNSCAAGVSVVNIDNGFGAGYLANMINMR